VGALDVRTRLRHFAIVTYAVDPAALRPHVHSRFDLDTVLDRDGRRCALISVVPFQDVDFAFLKCPWPRWSFGQTNYRAYVIDSVTGTRCVWFFGTALDFVGVVIPRHAWRLPWYRASIAFDCDYDVERKRYRSYKMTTASRWAPAQLEIEDSGIAPTDLTGFDNLEAGLVTLTHPLDGYYFRRDARLGTYRVAHARLQPTVGRLLAARFPLLEQLGLVATAEAGTPHSVLLQPETEFTIQLPPTLASTTSAESEE
jgi:hypothetical protein